MALFAVGLAFDGVERAAGERFGAYVADETGQMEGVPQSGASRSLPAYPLAALAAVV